MSSETSVEAPAAAPLPALAASVPAPSPAPAVLAPDALAVLLTATAPAPGGVPGGRERIDEVDAQIVELIQRRIEVSRQIQAARLLDGGRRVDLRRETEIISRYTTALGRPGTTIAMALLELGRGRA
jgi:chorismate mutase